MKLMIDISAEDFEKVKCGRGAVSMMRKAIIHGIPLSSVEPERNPELIRKFRDLQQKALAKGYTQSGGYCRGVTDCLRIMLNEYEVPESPGDFETRGCCS